jgi:hypothetical protein
MSTAVSFALYSLQSANIITTWINYDDAWTIEHQSVKKPRIDGWIFLWKYFRKKEIIVRWYMTHDTASDLNDLIDTFKKNLWVAEQFLDITVNSVVRRTVATATSINFWRKNYHLTFIPFEVTFTTVVPFFFLTSDNTDSKSAQSSSPVSMTVVNEWTAFAEPVVTVTFDTWTTALTVTMTIDWISVSASDTYSATDVLVFNWRTKQVTLNWTEIEYSWTFPDLATGTNNIEFTVSWTFLADFDVVHITRFI